jgi:hypothetical protein
VDRWTRGSRRIFAQVTQYDLPLDQRKPSLTVARVTRGMKVTVQVRADGLLGGTPPTTSKSIKVKR